MIFMWMSIFILLGIYLEVDCWANGNATLKHFGEIPEWFQNWHIILYSHNLCIRVPVSPHLCQYLLLSIFAYSYPSRCDMLWFWYAFLLQPKMLNIFSYAYWLVYLLCRNINSDTLPIIKYWLSFYYSVLRVLHIVNIKVA